MTRQLKPHGTPAAAMRHWRAGEELCEPCRRARNKQARNHYRGLSDPKRAHARAERAAVIRLIEIHRVEYRKILIEELQRANSEP